MRPPIARLLHAFEKQYGIKVVSTSPVDFGKLRAMVRSATSNGRHRDRRSRTRSAPSNRACSSRSTCKIIDLSHYPEAPQKRKFVFPKGLLDVIGYRTDVFKDGGGPKSWADFWDQKKFPGRARCRTPPSTTSNSR